MGARCTCDRRDGEPCELHPGPFCWKCWNAGDLADANEHTAKEHDRATAKSRHPSRRPT